jgi:hypothetical protein
MCACWHEAAYLLWSLILPLISFDGVRYSKS